MDRTVLAKRTAQKLAREGRLSQAIEEMRRVVGEAEVDPYDHVYLGDLIFRMGDVDEAIGAWSSAVSSYEKVGLYRNAIAICKKILRLAPRRHALRKTLVGLLLREGLTSEAMPLILEYVDLRAPENPPRDELVDMLDKLAVIPALPPEITLRLSESYQRLGEVDRAVSLLEEMRGRVETAGNFDAADLLRQRAGEVQSSAPPAPEPGAIEAEGQSGGVGPDGVDAEKRLASPLADSLAPLAPGAFDLGRDLISQLQSSEPSSFELGVPRGEPGIAPATASDAAAADAAVAPDALVAPDAAAGPASHAGTASQAAAPAPPAAQAGIPVEHFPLPAPSLRPGPLSSPREPSTSRSEPASGLPAEAAWLDDPQWRGASADAPQAAAEPAGSGHEWSPDSSERGTENADTDLEDAGEKVIEIPEEDAPFLPPEGAAGEEWEDPDPGVRRRDLLARAERAYTEERWADSRALFEQILHDHPLDREILPRLVAISERLLDRASEVHYRTLLGDAWIEEGDLEEALRAFIEVLRIDPEDSTARRRISRFREMGVPGTEEVPEEAHRSIPALLETSEARVSVDEARTDIKPQEWVDLEALLEEFKSGIKNQIDDGDFRSHYDLALSHHAMGLFEEALEELEAVLTCPTLPRETEWPARELRGVCLSELGRTREAIHEFREALDKSGGDQSGRWSVLYHLGRALESAEEWREAEEAFRRIVEESPAYRDAEARMRSCRLKAESAGRAAA